jgi:hypothetical protein
MLLDFPRGLLRQEPVQPGFEHQWVDTLLEPELVSMLDDVAR